MCNCSISVPIPSVFCSSCRKLLCILCDKDYMKCSSCSYFSCNECTIKLLCKHNYCSLKCVDENNQNTCDKKCMFISDIVSTEYTKHGLVNLIYHWLTIEQIEKNVIKSWLEDLKEDNDIYHYNINSNKMDVKIDTLLSQL